MIHGRIFQKTVLLALLIIFCFSAVIACGKEESEKGSVEKITPGMTSSVSVPVEDKQVSETPTPTSTPSPAEEPTTTLAASPTNTPEPTSTPEPTPTPDPTPIPFIGDKSEDIIISMMIPEYEVKDPGKYYVSGQIENLGLVCRAYTDFVFKEYVYVYMTAEQYCNAFFEGNATVLRKMLVPPISIEVGTVYADQLVDGLADATGNAIIYCYKSKGRRVPFSAEDVKEMAEGVEEGAKVIIKDVISVKPYAYSLIPIENSGPVGDIYSLGYMICECRTVDNKVYDVAIDKDIYLSEINPGASISFDGGKIYIAGKSRLSGDVDMVFFEKPVSLYGYALTLSFVDPENNNTQEKMLILDNAQ